MKAVNVCVLGLGHVASEVHLSQLTNRVQVGLVFVVWRTHVGRVQRRRILYAPNYGARCSLGDILGFLDDDIILDEQWCKKVIQTFSDPSVER